MIFGGFGAGRSRLLEWMMTLLKITFCISTPLTDLVASLGRASWGALKKCASVIDKGNVLGKSPQDASIEFLNNGDVIKGVDVIVVEVAGRVG